MEDSKYYEIREEYGTPIYIYDEEHLIHQAKTALNFMEREVIVRYAMKANPNKSIIKIFHSLGLHFDCSSGFEVMRILKNKDISPQRISLSTQELPLNFKEIIEMGILFNACSIHQLEIFGQLCRGGKLGIRFNPGTGSGFSKKTNVAGKTSSFGIWKEDIERVGDICKMYNLGVIRIHTHIGSGTDADVFVKACNLTLEIVNLFPDCHTINIGGGYKIKRVESEEEIDLPAIGREVEKTLLKFEETKKKCFTIEIEPGTFLIGNAGVLLSSIQDMTSTGSDGYNFLKLDSGMTEILRPTLYGSQHQIKLISKSREEVEMSYVVVGHCCESGDVISVNEKEHGEFKEIKMKQAHIGDMITIGGIGAYCSSMSAKNYNSYPDSAEILLIGNEKIPRLIRKRQTLDQMIINEM